MNEIVKSIYEYPYKKIELDELKSSLNLMNIQIWSRP